MVMCLGREGDRERQTETVRDREERRGGETESGVDPGGVWWKVGVMVRVGEIYV